MLPMSIIIKDTGTNAIASWATPSFASGISRCWNPTKSVSTPGDSPRMRWTKYQYNPAVICGVTKNIERKPTKGMNPTTIRIRYANNVTPRHGQKADR